MSPRQFHRPRAPPQLLLLPDDMSSEEGEGPPKRPKTGAASAFIAEPDQLLPAAEDGDAHLVAAALRNPLTDPNMTDQIGMTALMRATVHGRASVVMLLLANERVDPNIADSQGRTALIWAAGLISVKHASILKKSFLKAALSLLTIRARQI